MGKTISFEEKRSCLMFYAIGALLHLACVAVLVLFLTGNITLGWGLDDDSAYPISLQFLGVMLVGAVGCVIMILGERRYFADRGLRAPFIFMLIPQFIFVIAAAALLIYPDFMVLSEDTFAISGGIFVFMSILIVIAKIVVGIKLISRNHPCFGVLLLLTAIGIIILLAVMLLDKSDMMIQNFTAAGLSTWIYLGLTTLETVAALIMFLTNKCCCKGKCAVEAPAYVAEQPTAAPEVEEIPESPKDITTE